MMANLGMDRPPGNPGSVTHYIAGTLGNAIYHFTSQARCWRHPFYLASEMLAPPLLPRKRDAGATPFASQARCWRHRYLLMH